MCAAVGAMADGDAAVFDRLAAPASPLLVALLAGAAPQSRNVSLPSPDFLEQCVEVLSRSRETLLRGELSWWLWAHRWQLHGMTGGRPVMSSLPY